MLLMLVTYEQLSQILKKKNFCCCEIGLDCSNLTAGLLSFEYSRQMIFVFD